MKKNRKNRIIFILSVLLIVSIGFPIVKEHFFPENKAEVSSQAVKLRLEDMGELATQEAYVTSVNTIDKSQKLFGSFQIPFTQTKYVYSYDCQVKAGYDFSKITVHVDDAKKTVTFHLPPCKILSTEIDTDSLKVYHEQESVFTPVKLKESNEALQKMKEDAQTQAIHNGIKKAAKENAQKMLKALVAQMLPEEEYTYAFQ